jgi:hypothetical protein
MTIWWLVLILTLIWAFGAAFIWLATRLQGSRPGAPKTLAESLQAAAEDDVGHIFNQEFREELRNRGRLHFEKILGENAMFLQQDLRLTTSQLNEYMRGEISRELKEAFANYQSAITDAKQLAIESIEKTKTAIDDERKSLVAQLEKEVAEEKARRVKQFEERMAQVINHYLLSAVGNQIDLSDQLEYILSELETNKAAIVEDIRSGT